ncbi:heme-binding protein [Halosegnis sp.]|uniref:heme-binding protein n=1 Tax=Halosegnis sp. TaxID=2864959 RepID=UPI0035D422DC
MDRREAPATEEGWYALHDLRRIDWDAWRAATERERERALEEGEAFLQAHEALEDADAGGSAVFTVAGHEADIMLLHLRPSTAHLDRAERAFEQTALAAFTERTYSYLSVTEVSGYLTEELADGLENIESDGTRQYMQQRLYPSIPDAEHVCFYPMDKRRGPDQNWYDLPIEERRELIAGHGEVGREYAGQVTQIITGSMGLDDYEWGVTLFADDATAIKRLLAEMRFDPSSSRYAEFGPFYFGRRFAPAHLSALFAGEPLPAYGTDEGDETGDTDGTDEQTDTAVATAQPDDGTASSDTGAAAAGDGGRPDTGGPSHEETSAAELAESLRRVGIDVDDHPDAGYGLLFFSDEDAERLVEEVDGLRGNFDHYDTHVVTTVRAESGRSAVVSLWANERAANTASGFLADLPGVGEGLGGPVGSADSSPERAADDETAAGADGSQEAAVNGATSATNPAGTADDDDIRGALADLDIYAGQPHGEDVYAMVLYSEADIADVREEVASLSSGFDRYDTHVRTALYEGTATDRAAVVSLWETRDAADTAGDYLADLPGIVRRAGEGSNFGTMGMFYTVKPEYREEFRDRFETVGEMLAEMDGHLETDLMVNDDDENDMFIASQWEREEDAMAFFRSDDFRETVQWGREVLADRPRHVFLA